jgi:hypothetical protein
MMEHNDRDAYNAALGAAERLLGTPLERMLEPGAGEPANSADFKRLATVHTFGDAWPRTDILDLRTRALLSSRSRPMPVPPGRSRATRSQCRPSMKRPEAREDPIAVLEVRPHRGSPIRQCPTTHQITRPVPNLRREIAIQSPCPALGSVQ